MEKEKVQQLMLDMRQREIMTSIEGEGEEGIDNEEKGLKRLLRGWSLVRNGEKEVLRNEDRRMNEEGIQRFPDGRCQTRASRAMEGLPRSTQNWTKYLFIFKKCRRSPPHTRVMLKKCRSNGYHRLLAIQC